MSDFTLQEQFDNHIHDGRGSKRIKGRNLEKAPQPALTAQSGSISTGSGGTYIASSSATALNNLITRVGEIESVLENLGLIKPN